MTVGEELIVEISRVERARDLLTDVAARRALLEYASDLEEALRAVRRLHADVVEI